MTAQDITFTGQLVVSLFDGHLADTRCLSQFADRIEAHTGYHPAFLDFPAIILIDLYIIRFANRFIELQHRDLAPSPFLELQTWWKYLCNIILYRKKGVVASG